MPDLATLGLFVLATVAILLVPGPTVLYIVTCSLKRDWRTGLVSVLGVETGSLFQSCAPRWGFRPCWSHRPRCSAWSRGWARPT